MPIRGRSGVSAVSRHTNPLAPPTLPNDPAGALRYLRGKFEPALTLGSSLPGAARAGLQGLGTILSGGGLERAAEQVADMQQRSTYAPRTAEGQQGLTSILGTAADIGETLTQAVPALSPEYRGDKALELTGSPLVATLADMAEPTDLVAPGAKLLGAPLGIMAGQRFANRMFNSSVNNPEALRALRVAGILEQQGKSPQEIWAATAEHFRRTDTPLAGVVRGVDGEWRIEIPDDQARLIDGPLHTTSLGEVLSHPTLLDPDPLLKHETSVIFDMGLPAGSGSFGSDPRGVNAEMRISPFAEPEGLRSTLLHETQHNVQALEDFARGGNPTMAFRHQEAHDILQRLRQEAATPLSLEEFAQQAGFPDMDSAQRAYPAYVRGLKHPAPWLDAELQKRAGREYYDRLAGEAEARQTEARRNLTLEERRARFPDQDFDVPRADQIVKRRGEGASLRSMLADLLTGGN